MKRLIDITAALAWMGLIFHASSLPSSATGPSTPGWIFFLKTLHFMSYGVLALLFLSLLKGRRKIVEIGPAIFVLSLLFTVVYAVSDEYHQKFSPGRHASIKDVMIDTLGATIFIGTTFLLRRKTSGQKGP